MIDLRVITPLQTIAYMIPMGLMSFVIGLYVGSFVQRRRDVSEMRVMRAALKKLSDVLMDSNEKKEEEK